MAVPASTDDDWRGGKIVVITMFTISLSLVIVVLRLIARLKIVKLTGHDDWAIVIALAFAIGASISVVFRVHYGLGRHIWTLSKQELILHQKALWYNIIFFNSGIMAAKISLLLQYRRLFLSEAMQLATSIATIIVTLYGLSQVLISIFTCIPIAAAWDFTIRGKCVSNLVEWWVNSIANILTDWTIFALPLPALGSLKLARKQKIILLGVFCLGFLICIVSILRIPALILAAKTKDPTWDDVDAALLSLVELNLGIICASLPTLRPWIKLIAGLVSQFTNANGSSGSDDSEGNGIVTLGRIGAVRRIFLGTSLGTKEVNEHSENPLDRYQFTIETTKELEETQTTSFAGGESVTGSNSYGYSHV